MNIKYPRILVVNIIFYKKTKHITLGPILNSEAFINSNYCVMENIFLK